MGVQDYDLLLNTFIFVKALEQISCKFMSSVMPNKLDIFLNCVWVFSMYILIKSSLSDLARRQNSFMHLQASSTIISKYLLQPYDCCTTGRRRQFATAQMRRIEAFHGCLKTIIGPFSLLCIHYRCLKGLTSMVRQRSWSSHRQSSCVARHSDRNAYAHEDRFCCSQPLN